MGLGKLFSISFSVAVIFALSFIMLFSLDFRNASYCDEMSVELRVFEKTEASLPFISYPQILTLSTSGSLVCPELSEFTHNKMDMKIQWYKVHL